MVELRLSETDKSEFSPIYQVYELPVSQTIPLPIYEPWPNCDFAQQDVTYTLTDSGAIPNWFVFEESERTITIDADE